MMPVDDVTSGLVSWALDLAQLRQTVAATNVANAHTSGHRSQQVDFSAQLTRMAESRTDEAALRKTLSSARDEGFLLSEDAPSTLLDATVALDQQMAEITKSSLQYQSLVEGLNRKFGLMRLAVTGGRQG